MNNHLLLDWNTPFGTPPFPLIRIADFKPAIEESIKKAYDEILLLAENPEPPDFNNTIAALDRVGDRLGDISAILFNLNNAETCKELQSVTQEVSPLLTRFSNDITLNEQLFKRVKSVYEVKEQLSLNTEQMLLLEKNYRNFILGGAGLADEKKSRFREISEELSALAVKFEENVLAETNAFILHVTNHDDLEGLPDGVVEMASMEAKSRGQEGWIFTLHFPSYVPFMKFSARRELREKMLRAYSSRAYHKDENDNRKLAVRIADLRLEIANILGYKNFAEMELGDRMADTIDKVRSFLDELHAASFPAAKRDYDEIVEYASSLGHKGNVERWDWAYFSEKLQKEKFDIDDEVLKPYFVLENAEQAIFELATKLYGIKFIPDSDIPVYHPEVKTWEVRDTDGTFLSILYADYFPRAGKSGGAWMTNYRDGKIAGENEVRPLISIVANFTRPTETRPSLLSFNELTTFLHEFGHSLHGILTKCTFEGLSGTNVARDFVELPSQFMENYAYENEWLSNWATHYQTGEIIPAGIIMKIRESSTFNEGYACNRQLGFGFLDVKWHTITEPVKDEISAFEISALERTELFRHIEGTNMSVSFTHIFGGGYAAGYYGYKWAEVLDADAFKYFKEKGIFDSETATSFRKNILEKGGSDKPMKLYVNFRGKEPSIDAFLERSGLKPPALPYVGTGPPTPLKGG